MQSVRLLVLHNRPTFFCSRDCCNWERRHPQSQYMCALGLVGEGMVSVLVCVYIEGRLMKCKSEMSQRGEEQRERLESFKFTTVQKFVFSKITESFFFFKEVDTFIQQVHIIFIKKYQKKNSKDI